MFKSTILQTLLLFAIIFTTTTAFTPSNRSAAPSFTHSKLQTQRYNIIDQFQAIYTHWGKKVTASHILITPRTWNSQEDAKEQLTQLKSEINDDPVKFAEAARQVSECPTKAKGGELGEFGPGRMVVNFDKVCFNEDVGVVHGPVSTQFGEHLIFITQRTGEE